MKHELKRHSISFKNAWSGFMWACQSQPNYKIHLAFSVLAILGGFFLSISYNEWLIIMVLIMLGFIIETINTAIETTTDCIDTEWREDIKIAKDLSAGAMLVFAAGSFTIACVIFLPKIFGL